MTTFVLITVTALAVVLAAERRGLEGVQWIAKPVASWGFVAAALSLGAAGSIAFKDKLLKSDRAAARE